MRAYLLFLLGLGFFFLGTTGAAAVRALPAKAPRQQAHASFKQTPAALSDASLQSTPGIQLIADYLDDEEDEQAGGTALLWHCAVLSVAAHPSFAVRPFIGSGRPCEKGFSFLRSDRYIGLRILRL